MADLAFPALAVEAEKLARDIALMPQAHHRFARTERIWTYRSYEGGEPAYLIDWKQSARSEKILTRTPEPMPIRPVFLWTAPSAAPDEESARLQTILMALGFLMLKANRPVGWLDESLRLTRAQGLLRGFFADGLSASSPGHTIPDPFGLRGALLVIATDFSGDQASKILAYAMQDNKGILLDASAALPAPDDKAELRIKAENLGWPILSPRPGETPERLLLLLYQEALKATV